MDRLVYSPSVKCWVKSDFGVIDLSPYVTECKVERKINDISKLEVVFRNPKVLQDGRPRFLFTERVQSDGNLGPVFHPMDPITVVLERIAGRPIQAFTGYCDAVPYVQLFPGVTRITASCTLKRLQYTYWDPGLPFVHDFMSKYGWMLGGDGTVRKGGSSNEKTVDPNSTKNTSLNDSSIGKLLYAVLNEVGGWNNNNIYIQPLPDNIGSIVTKLFDEIKKENEDVNKEITKFIRDIIGNGEFGSALTSGPTGGAAGGGGTVSMVGDSITYLSKSQIEQKIPGITIYCESSKHFAWGSDGYGTSDQGGDSGLKILKDHQSSLGDIVVVALGTNDDPDKATFGRWIDKAMSHIGSSRKAVFVTVTNRDSHNQAMQEAKSRHSNIYIADWKAKAELVPGDVHPTEHGKQVFAKVIADVVNPLRPQGGSTATGTKTFQGKPVAAWIVPILEWAQQHGWNGTITSGFRTYAKQAELKRADPRAADPGTSSHEFTEYPKGAIDVGGFGDYEAGRQLWNIIKNYPHTPNLVWGPNAGNNDGGHFSGTGH